MEAGWLNKYFPHGKDHTSKKSKVPKVNLAQQMPVPKKESARVRSLEQIEDAWSLTRLTRRSGILFRYSAVTPNSIYLIAFFICK
jgi:hypothetical protein